MQVNVVFYPAHYSAEVIKHSGLNCSFCGVWLLHYTHGGRGWFYNKIKRGILYGHVYIGIQHQCWPYGKCVLCGGYANKNFVCTDCAQE